MADVTGISVSTAEITLTANQVTTVTFDSDVTTVEVVSNGVAKIRWTCDGTTPNATTGWFMPSGLVMVDSRQPTTAALTVVKLWSDGAPTVVVQRDT